MELASICRRAHTELEGTAILSRSRGRDRWFESTFLQRRVACEPEDDIDIPVPRHILGRPRTASSGDQSPCSSHRRVESCARQVQQIGHGESGAAHFGAIARARLKDETNYRCSLGTNTVLGLVTKGLLAVLPDGGVENWSLGPPGRACDADGRRLRQGVWVVAEKSVVPDPFCPTARKLEATGFRGVQAYRWMIASCARQRSLNDAR